MTSKAENTNLAFFQQNTLQIAQKLLGMHLAHYSPEGLSIGRIVETEAYLQDDPACHASRGITNRNAAMFGPPAHAYIYFIYGMYHCFNVVTAAEGKGEAVLIRALEPIVGIDLMQKRRGKKHLLHQLCNGPGKLVIAMGIHAKQNHHNLLNSELRILSKNYFGKSKRIKIKSAKRIGIKKGAELPYRFFIEGNSFISK